MTSGQTTKAILLRSVEYGDRDLIVTLLLDGDGKRAAMARGAKGSKRRFVGALEAFRVAEVTYRERRSSLGLLTEAHVVESFSGIETSFDKIAVASYVTELVREMLREGDGADEAFAFLVSCYRDVDIAQDEPKSLERVLLRQVLAWLALAGFAPSLAACCGCGTNTLDDEGEFYLARSGEGVACHRCLGGIGTPVGRVSGSTLSWLHALQTGLADDILWPDRDRVVESRRVVTGIVAAVLGKEPRTTGALKLALP